MDGVDEDMVNLELKNSDWSLRIGNRGDMSRGKSRLEQGWSVENNNSNDYMHKLTP